MNLNHDIEEQVKRHVKNWVLENEVMPSSSEIEFLVKTLTALFEEHSKEKVRRELVDLMKISNAIQKQCDVEKSEYKPFLLTNQILFKLEVLTGKSIKTLVEELAKEDKS